MTSSKNPLGRTSPPEGGSRTSPSVESASRVSLPRQTASIRSSDNPSSERRCCCPELTRRRAKPSRTPVVTCTPRERRHPILDVAQRSRKRSAQAPRGSLTAAMACCRKESSNREAREAMRASDYSEGIRAGQQPKRRCRSRTSSASITSVRRFDRILSCGSPRMNRMLATITLHVSAALFLLAPASLFAANEYQINLSVDPARGILHGKEKVVYKNETEAPLDTLFLEAPGLPGNPATPGNERWRGRAVGGAKGEKAALAWKAEEEAYNVHLSTPLGAGFKTTFTFEYERNLTPVDSAAGYLSFPDRDAATWYLKFRAYRAGSLGSDDFKDISITLAGPPGWMVASSASPGPAQEH